MGGSQAPQQIPNRCNQCESNKCKQCSACKCQPLLEANKDCLKCSNADKKIVINLDPILFIDIMKSQIKSMWVQTKLSTSQIPFIGGNIQHCLVVFQVEYVHETRINKENAQEVRIKGLNRNIDVINKTITRKVVVEGVRTKGIKGKMEVKISPGGGLSAKYSETRQIRIDKSFKKLYQYLQNNQNQRQYDRYLNNCYHLAIAIYQFILGPQLKYELVKPIHDLKDEQIHKFWH